MVLQKLDWFQSGGGVSDRQWRDVVRMLKVQADKLDFGYLQHWAGVLDLSEILPRALEEAGRPDRPADP